MKTQSSTPTNRRPFLATWARILLILALVLSQAFIGAVPVAHAAAAWTAYDYSYVGTGEPSTNITTVKTSVASTGNALKKYSDGTTISGITFAVAVSDVTEQSGAYGGEVTWVQMLIPLFMVSPS